MDLANKFYYFKKALDKDTCEKIIQLGKDKIQSEKDKGRSVEGTTAGGYEKGLRPNAKPREVKTTQELLAEGVEDSYIRDSKITWFTDQWMFDLLKPYVYRANEDAGWRWSIDFHEDMQFTSYDSGGFYGWHTDGGSDHFSKYRRVIRGVSSPELTDNTKSGHYGVVSQGMVGKVRKISMTVNLTDETAYEGGDLMLDLGDHTTRGKYKVEDAREQGTIIIFPSFLHHCVSPVTSGTRYSLVMWSLGEPWK
jgi:PKHD-type hydroxylase